MAPTLHQIACLVDDARLAELEEMLGLIEGDFLFKLIATQSTIERRAFDGQKSRAVTTAYSDGTPVTATDVALLNAAAVEGQLLVAVVLDKELTFDFQSAQGLVHQIHGVGHVENGEQNEHAENPFDDFFSLLGLFLLVSTLLGIKVLFFLFFLGHNI